MYKKMRINIFLQCQRIQVKYLFPEQLQDVIGNKKKKGCSPSTHEGLFLVVPATFPGKQEHLTVCDRSSMRFLLQHLCAAITSHVPPSDKEGREREKSKQIKSASRRDQTEPTHGAGPDKSAA